MSPAVSEHVKLGSTPMQNASSCAALPAVLQSTTHVLLTHFWFTPGAIGAQALPVAHALPGNEPFGKHAFSPPASKHE
jgi:hypothetical protein